MKKYPSYLNLVETGELQARADELLMHLESCDLCPRECKVSRNKGEKGFCNAGASVEISSVCAHRGEEPAISGFNGSGTIFFSHCNLKCVFCQNFQISQGSTKGNQTLTAEELAQQMLYLQNSLGVHNINFVSPTHYSAQILAGVAIAASKGLHIPLVYNTNAYDSLFVLEKLHNVIDIYLPDLKYCDDKFSAKYSGADNYSEVARKAIKKMFEQTGNLEVDSDGLAKRGMIVRHLVLPNNLAGSSATLTWLAKEISEDITVSVMSQYHPCNKAHNYPELNRRLTRQEYEEVLEIIEDLGLENGYVQALPSADYYLPDFESDSHPFEK